MTALVPILAIVGIAIYYFYFARTGGSQGRVDKHFGLQPGETSTAYWSAKFATEIPFGSQAATVALGLLAGAMVGSLAITSLRPRGISLVLTSFHRLVLCIENEDGTIGLFSFQPGELAVTILGDGGRKMQSQASLLIRLEQAGVPPIDMRVHHSAGPLLQQWSQQQQQAAPNH